MNLQHSEREVIDRCPSLDDLLAAAVGLRNTSGESALERHLESCDACARRVRETRMMIAAVHSLPQAEPSRECLDAEVIASLVDGVAAPDGLAMAHAAGCAHCRSRIAAMAQVMADHAVSSELRALQARPQPSRRSARRYMAFTGLAAAAVAAIVLLEPTQERLQRDRQNTSIDQHREPGTSTTAQQIAALSTTATPGGSLRWSGVPEADLYRVRIWNAEGAVVSTTETRDTTVALPSGLLPDVQYMWDVSARTGWDRWVSSDLAELTLSSR
jgi:anti-sigma factor RsiW